MPLLSGLVGDSEDYNNLSLTTSAINQQPLSIIMIRFTLQNSRCPVNLFYKK